MRLDNPETAATPEERTEQLIALIENATRTLRIRSAHLDPTLFDQTDVSDAISRFVRSSRNAEVKILLDDPARLLVQGHRILELARRLSDKIEIREYYDEKEHERDSTVLFDLRGIMIAPQDQASPAIFSKTDAIQTSELVEVFDHHWQMSPLARQLRLISL